jgi:DNA-binding transcriptional LysR family regulator
MELRHLRYFLAVADTGSFTKAAARHFVAQSALSQQIGRLEAELGTALFHRTSRMVRLTEAGTSLVPLARRVIADADNIQAEMAALTGLRKGKLRLGLIQTPATTIDVIAVMGEFHERYAGIEFEVSSGTSTEMAAAVAHGELDLALVGLEEREVPKKLVVRRLSVEPLVAVVCAAGALGGRKRISVPELLAHGQFIHFRKGTGLRHRVDDALARAGVSVSGAFEMGQITDMIRLAALDVGVTIVPRTAAVDIGHIGGRPYTVITLTDDQARHPVSVVFDADRLSSAATAFLEALDRHVHQRLDSPSDS